MSHWVIKRGPTFQGTRVWIGMGGFVLSIAILFAASFGADLEPRTPAVLMAIILLLFFGGLAYDARGVLVDLENKRLKTYVSWFGYRSGNWEAISDFEFLKLDIDHITYATGNRLAPHTRKSRTFDLILVGAALGRTVLLEECMSYPEAKKKLHSYASRLQLKHRDFFADKLQQSKSSRRRR